MPYKGYKQSEEHKKNISKNNAKFWFNKKRPPFSEEWKKNIGKGHKGIKRTEEFKRKNRESHKGEKAYNWKGGYKNTLFLNRKRKIIKLGNSGFHLLTEWQTLKAQYNWTCPACKRKEPEIKLTEDHIIPLSKGGSNNIENIQPLCQSCNSKKHIKIIKY